MHRSKRIRQEGYHSHANYAVTSAIDKMAERIRHYQYLDQATLTLRLQFRSVEERRADIEAWQDRKAHDQLSDEELAERFINTNLFEDTPVYRNLRIEAQIDYQRNLGELSVTGHALRPKHFVGTYDHVADILELIAYPISLPIEDGDKVIYTLSTDGAEFSVDQPYDDGGIDGDHGWSPDSPEMASDTEKEVFFPNT